MKEQYKIAWIDSCGSPSHIHLTEDGIDTVCENHSEYIENRKLSQVPKKILGVSRFCKVCFKNGGKSKPWDIRCEPS